MAGSTRVLLMDWYRCRRQRQKPEAVEVAIDIELGTSGRTSRRADSGISISGLTLDSADQIAKPSLKSHFEEPIHLRLDFGDREYTKSLDYKTFSRWDAVEELLNDLEKDGVIVEELWDEIDNMRVGGGDWDARVRPGWILQVHCQSEEAFVEKDGSGFESDSEITEDGEECWLDDLYDQYQEDWCLPRWRDKVEQEASTRKYAKEPSWVVLGLGCISIVFFIVAVVVYTD